MLNKWKQAVFASEEVNLGRQKELDMGKAISILCLAWIHSIIECSTDEMLESGIPYLFDTVIGGPMSAPMYMFAMGLCLFYTRDRSYQHCFHYALKIAVIGLILNICRFLIPLGIGYLITGDSEKFLTRLPYRFFGNDVLQFAALALAILGCFKKWNLSPRIMLLIAAVMSLLGTLLTGTDFQSPVLNTALGYILPTEEPLDIVISDFPILTWLICPVSGYCFGSLLIRVKDKTRFYGLITPVALVISISYFWYGITHEVGMFGEGQNCYYHMLTNDMAASIINVIAMLGIYYFIGLLLPEGFHRVFHNISRNINRIYCIHWVFVIWITNVILYICRGTQILPVGSTMLLGTAIMIVSVALANIWDSKIRDLIFRRKHNGKEA